MNVKGTENLLMHLHGVAKFIFCSTTGVQGFGYKRATEELPYNGRGIYEKSKAEAEKRVILICAKKGIDWIIVRPDFVYGPGDMRRLALYRKIAEKRMYILGNGQSSITPTYVEDVIQSFGKCITEDNASNNIFNISGELLTIEFFLATIADILNTSLPKTRVPLILANIAASVCEITFRHIVRKEPPITKSRVAFLTQNHG